MENSLACATAVFGVLAAGEIFVMVNAQTPEDRLRYIVDDSGLDSCSPRAHSAASRREEREAPLRSRSSSSPVRRST
jgi:acyl-CoA synthetase (AMP-forming)/AMP-acid ligase II